MEGQTPARRRRHKERAIERSKLLTTYLEESRRAVLGSPSRDVAELLYMSDRTSPIVTGVAWGNGHTTEGEMVLSRMDSSDPCLRIIHQHLARMWDLGRYQLYRVMYSPGNHKTRVTISDGDNSDRGQSIFQSIITRMELIHGGRGHPIHGGRGHPGFTRGAAWTYHEIRTLNRLGILQLPTVQKICDTLPEAEWLTHFKKHFTCTPASLQALTKAEIRHHLWSVKPVQYSTKRWERINPLASIRKLPLPRRTMSYLAESDYALPFDYGNNILEQACFRQVLQITGSVFSPPWFTRWLVRPWFPQLIMMSRPLTAWDRGPETAPSIITRKCYLGYATKKILEITHLMVHSQRAGIPREPASHLEVPIIKICSCRKRLTSTTLQHHLGLINYMLAHLHVSGRTLNVITQMRRELEDVLGLTEGSFNRGTSLSTQRIHQVALASASFLNTSCPTAECVGTWIEIGKNCDRRTPWEIKGTLCPSTPVLDMP